MHAPHTHTHTLAYQHCKKVDLNSFIFNVPGKPVTEPGLLLPLGAIPSAQVPWLTREASDAQKSTQRYSVSAEPGLESETQVVSIYPMFSILDEYILDPFLFCWCQSGLGSAGQKLPEFIKDELVIPFPTFESFIPSCVSPQSWTHGRCSVSTWYL